MRVYIPATVAALRAAVAAGQVRAPGRHAFGATEILVGQYPGADLEEVEYVAMQDAARASLRLLSASDGAPIRVVIAADTNDATPDPHGDPSSVFVHGSVAWRDVAAVHLDGADAAEAVRAAAAVVDQADLGDPDAEFVLGTAEDFELAWYAPDEIAYLVEELGD